MPPLLLQFPNLAAEIKWAEDVTAFGTVVAALALIVAIWTINDAKYANANGWMLTLDEKFLENPELRTQFFDPNQPYDPNQHELAAFVEYAADSWDFFLKHRFGVGTRRGAIKKFFLKILSDDRSGIDGLQPSWQREVFTWLEKSRVFREYLVAHRDTYQHTDSALGRLFQEWERLHPGKKP